MELDSGDGRPTVELLTSDGYAAMKRRRRVDAEEACRLIATGLRAYTHCTPGSGLGVTRRHPPGNRDRCSGRAHARLHNTSLAPGSEPGRRSPDVSRVARQPRSAQRSDLLWPG
ncbi:DUF6233 domain-containing protein [Streptomyces sp. NPDC004082]